MKGKLYEGLDHAGDTSTHKSIVNAVNEAKKNFPIIQKYYPDWDVSDFIDFHDAVREWFKDYFGDEE